MIDDRDVIVNGEIRTGFAGPKRLGQSRRQQSKNFNTVRQPARGQLDGVKMVTSRFGQGHPSPSPRARPPRSRENNYVAGRSGPHQRSYFQGGARSGDGSGRLGPSGPLALKVELSRFQNRTWRRWHIGNDRIALKRPQGFNWEGQRARGPERPSGREFTRRGYSIQVQGQLMPVSRAGHGHPWDAIFPAESRADNEVSRRFIRFCFDAIAKLIATTARGATSAQKIANRDSRWRSVAVPVRGVENSCFRSNGLNRVSRRSMPLDATNVRPPARAAFESSVEKSILTITQRKRSSIILRALAIALPLLIVLPLRSDAMSAPDLLSACSGDAIARATCNGYLMAITDVVLQRESRGGAVGKVCVPATVTVDQVRDAVLNASHRPAARAPTAIRLVAAAMRLTWPCAGAPGEAPRPQ